MKPIFFALAVVLAASPALAGKKPGAGKKPEAAKPADPNAVVAKAHGGKVWVLSGAPNASEGEDLSKWLSSKPMEAELTKKPSDDRWPCTLLAVFKTAPAKGPITVEFLDKKDPKTLVDQYSSQNTTPALLFQEQYDLDTNNGFNKGRTYVVKVGQIIKNKFVAYATGEVTLK